MDANGNEPAWRPETVTVLGVHGEVTEIRAAGLTKREAFAMAAMQGMLVSKQPSDASRDAEDRFILSVALFATKHADALLAELAKETP